MSNAMKKTLQKLLALSLMLFVLAGSLGIAAGSAGAEAGICPNHTAHDNDCGYQEPATGTNFPCAHTCAECETAMVQIVRFIIAAEDDSTVLYLLEGVAVTEAYLLTDVSAEDENGGPVEVTVKDIGGLDLANPVSPGFPPTPYIVTYEAVHPESGEAFTVTREAYVTVGIQALALESLIVRVSPGGTRLTLLPQPAESGYAFYYTTNASSQAAPADGTPIGSISGATAYAANTIIGTGSGDLLYVQVFKVETGGNTVVGYGEGVAKTTLTAGNVYTGTIEIKSGVTTGTFNYVYSPNLYINEYLLEGVISNLPTTFQSLLMPGVGTELAQTSAYYNYNTTGSVYVDTAAAVVPGNWASVDSIIQNILKRGVQSTSTDVGHSLAFQYNVSDSNTYEVQPGGILQKSDKQGVTKVGYTVYSSTADAGLSVNASLTVDGTTLVSGGSPTGSSVSGASYNAAANTLTLTNYNGGAISASDMDLNIVLAGINTASANTMAVIGTGLFGAHGKITISGNGTLHVTNSKATGTSYGILGAQGVDILGGTVNVNVAAASYSYGIGTNGPPININVSGSASVASAVAGGTNADYALFGSAINIIGSAVIKEGDTAVGAATVSELTLADVSWGDPSTVKASRRYVSIVPDNAPLSYTLTVANGSGSGSYTNGHHVSITANTPPQGKVFDRWITSGGGTFGNTAGATTTFAMPSAHVTVTATYKNSDSTDSGGGSDSSDSNLHSRRTMTDPDTGVSVTGVFAKGATLIVKERLLHPSGSCDVCDDIRAHSDNGELIILLDISITAGYLGEVEMTIPVGSKYNGQRVTVIHCKNNASEEKVLTVVDGKVTGVFSGLSPFAVLKPASATTRPNPDTGRLTDDPDIPAPQTVGSTICPLQWLWVLIPAMAPAGRSGWAVVRRLT